jgi:hypothetical protein
MVLSILPVSDPLPKPIPQLIQLPLNLSMLDSASYIKISHVKHTVLMLGAPKLRPQTKIGISLQGANTNPIQ